MISLGSAEPPGRRVGGLLAAIGCTPCTAVSVVDLGRVAKEQSNDGGGVNSAVEYERLVMEKGTKGTR